MRIQLITLTLLLIFVQRPIFGQVERYTGESEFLAAKITSELLSNWIKEMDDGPESIGIFQINVNSPLRKEFAEVMEVEVIKQLRSGEQLKVTNCVECRTPILQVQGDRVLISKGSPSMDVLRELSKKYNLNTFLTLEVYRTKLSLMTTAKLFHAGSGEVISTESFRVPAINFQGAATQLMFQAGPGIPLGGKDLSSDESSTNGAVNLMIMEELGFGKGGLTLGGVTGNKSNLFYVLPTIGWRGSFGNSSIQSLKSIGVGFGSSQSIGGLAARGAYDIFLGSFTGIGIEGSLFVPIESDDQNEDDVLNGTIGLHIIFTLGR